MDVSEELDAKPAPRGMKRDGGLGKGSREWTSTYGNIVASVYEGGSADDLNEKGLVANMLYLAESEQPLATTKIPGKVIGRLEVVDTACSKHACWRSSVVDIQIQSIVTMGSLFLVAIE